MRLTRFGHASTLFLCAMGLLGAASSAPEEVVARLLAFNAAGQVSTPEARALLTGEALGAWTSPTIGPIEGAVDRVLEAGPAAVVARVPGVAPSGDVKDFYFFLDRVDGVWKVSTMRTLSSIGPLYMLRDAPPAAPADADDIYMRRNIALTLSSDAALRTWHSERRDDLAGIAARVASDPAPGHRVAQNGAGESAIGKQLRELGISSAERLAEGVRITVGGITDNSVGFLYLGSAPPPAISPDAFIWVEPLGEGWFLFRTT